MQEKQEIEQYFFDNATLDHLASFAARFENPCCLCTPSLGVELERRGIPTTTLDIDVRFSYLRDFAVYDISEPRRLDRKFGIIICDPPFLNVSLTVLLQAITLLSQDDYSQPLLVNYLSSRAPVITGIFSPFRLQPTGYMPGYQTIQNIGRNKMEFFGNLGPEFQLNPALRGI